MLDDAALSHLYKLHRSGDLSARGFLLQQANEQLLLEKPLFDELRLVVIDFLHQTTRFPINAKSARRVAIALHARDLVDRGYGRHRLPDGAYFMLGEAYGLDPKTVEKYFKLYGNF